MSMTTSEMTSKEAAYGWFADALGGVATAVLAIIALSGVHADTLLPIATIVFGAALLIEGGTMMSEYAHMSIVPGAGLATDVGSGVSGGGVSAAFAAGVAGIVLGILALVGIHTVGLCAIAVIVFGCALLFSSSAVWHLQTLKRAATPARELRSGTDVLAAEMAQGSSGLQALAGLAAIVLGILALILSISDVLTLVALLALGVALVLTGSAASETFMSVMRPYRETPRSSYGPAE